MARRAQRNLDEHRGVLARLGRSDEAVEAHLNAARKGCTFLFIYAPGELELERPGANAT
jgi:hypothetical protein